MTETPRANRFHLAFFGLRNAGKSTLVNALTGQPLAIVSDVPGTTTDPVSKAIEILPLGPCMVTDTAGLDDVGALGLQRVRRSLDCLATADVAIWVSAGDDTAHPAYRALVADCRARRIPLLHYRRGEPVAAFKERLAALRLADVPPPLLAGLVQAGETVVCVCPIDESAPKGRLILPQVQVIRAALDAGALGIVCQPAELETALARAGESPLVVTDSQVFGEVRARVAQRAVRLTSFSILFARQKGDLSAYVAGLRALETLREGDRVLIAEGCTHHRQCNDIGAVKIPRALERLTGKTFAFGFASGAGFDLAAGPEGPCRLVVQCGGCMLTRREVLRRIDLCRESGVPIVNYGMLLAAASGMTDIRPDGLIGGLAAP